MLLYSHLDYVNMDYSCSHKQCKGLEGSGGGFMALMYLEIEIFRAFSDVKAEIARCHVVHISFS